MNKLICYDHNGVLRYAYVIGYMPRGLLVDGGRGVEYVPSYLVMAGERRSER